MNTNKRNDALFNGGMTTEIEEVIYEGHEVRQKQQNCRSILVSLVVEEGPSVFVSICVHSWFVFIKRSSFFAKFEAG